MKAASKEERRNVDFGQTGAQAAVSAAASRPSTWSPAFERWNDSLRSLLNAASDPVNPSDFDLSASWKKTGVEVPFRGFLQPFLHVAVRRLRHLHENGQLSDVEPHLVGTLASRLLVCCTPTMVLELQVASVRGHLQGDDPSSRFQYFSERYLARPEVFASLIREYPVLCRQLLIVVDQWIGMFGDLFQRWAKASDAVAALAGVEPGSSMASVDAGLSDAHSGGRTVVAMQFEGGRRMIYKPRSIDVERQFGAFLSWLNGKGLAPSLLWAKCEAVDGAYGWVEYIDHVGCRTREEIARFFMRLGSLAAIIQLLGGVDFHYENVIAFGEHPIAVDLEGLFYRRAGREDGSALSRARQILAGSVLGTGLMPSVSAGRGRKPRIDLSGVGGQAGQYYPRPVPVVRDMGTDRMRLELSPVAVKPARNRPTLLGRPVDPGDFVEDIQEGYRRAYDLLLTHREEACDRMAEFGEVEVRHIARPTARYGRFIQEGWHPDYLRDSAARERLLGDLWTRVSVGEELERLIGSERRDLHNGDVPLFVCRPSHRHLWNTSGDCIEEYFVQSAVTQAQKRIRDFSPADRDAQISLIRQSLCPEVGGGEDPRRSSAGDSVGSGSADLFLAAAVSIGEQLRDTAVLGSHDVCWIGPTLVPGELWEWRLSPIGVGLYDGLAGLAVFFAHLAAATGRDDFQELGDRALGPVRRALQEFDPRKRSDIGAYSGHSSLAMAVGQVGRCRDDGELLEEAVRGILRVREQVPDDRGFDLLSGAAGCAVVAVRLFECTGDAALAELAAACGERLVESASRLERGRGWVGLVSDRPLGGFAHGAGGIAWALVELAGALEEPRYRRLAMEAVEYETGLFSAERHNWADLRSWDDRATDFSGAAWCHGCAGIALSRLLMRPHLTDGNELDEEIDIGIKETIRSGFGKSNCLCHGDLGNAAIVSLAASRLGRQDWEQVSREHAARAAAGVLDRVWRCGIPGHRVAPGLMLGLSGMGLELLRLARPDDVPSVLWLEVGVGVHGQHGSAGR